MTNSVIYRGGEIDSVNVISGSASISTAPSQRDAAYSDCSLGLFNNVYGQYFYNPETGIRESVSAPDALCGMCLFHTESGGGSGPILTILDEGDRPAIRVFNETGIRIQLQRNTSGTGTPSWQVLAEGSSSGSIYIAFKVKFGASGEYALYINGDLSGSGSFSDTLPGPLARFTSGSSNTTSYISQFQFSRNKSMVNARVLTRKASGAGASSQMTGTYADINKIFPNDSTAIISDVVGQISTFTYQSVTVPEGMEMDGDVWLWQRGKNDESEPSSMKVLDITDSVTTKSANLPFDVGFQQMPAVFDNMTPEKWNSGQRGFESTTP